jgi:hypothetical protein
MRALKLHFSCSSCSLVVLWLFFASSSESHGRMICWKILNPRDVDWNIKAWHMYIWWCTSLCSLLGSAGGCASHRYVRGTMDNDRRTMTQTLTRTRTRVTHRNFGWRTDERRGRVWSTTVDASTVAFLLIFLSIWKKKVCNVEHFNLNLSFSGPAHNTE